MFDAEKVRRSAAAAPADIRARMFNNYNKIIAQQTKIVAQREAENCWRTAEERVRRIDLAREDLKKLNLCLNAIKEYID
jgi:hypothetical protein